MNKPTVTLTNLEGRYQDFCLITHALKDKKSIFHAERLFKEMQEDNILKSA